MFLLTLTASSGAHELGLTRVTVTFTADGRYQVDVLVDPESLLAKLEILAGQQPSIGVPLGELPGRIIGLQEVALARTRLLFEWFMLPKRMLIKLDLVLPLPVPFDAQGRANVTFTVPPLPGLTVWLQGASLTPQLPATLGFDASGALRVANLF